MLIMTSIIQSKVCHGVHRRRFTQAYPQLRTDLSELEEKPSVHEIFLKDTKIAYRKMLAAQEVRNALA